MMLTTKCLEHDRQLNNRTSASGSPCSWTSGLPHQGHGGGFVSSCSSTVALVNAKAGAAYLQEDLTLEVRRKRRKGIVADERSVAAAGDPASRRVPCEGSAGVHQQFHDRSSIIGR